LNAEIVARNIRENILRLTAEAGTRGNGAHIAPSLSEAEILSVLFVDIMRPQDTFILSKGHGALGLYAALYEAGKIIKEQLEMFETDGGDFPGQPSKTDNNAIEFSSGSLGMGLTYAAGLALAAKRCGSDKRIYVLLGDGEMNEGSNWEAIMFAKHQRLDNLIAVIDNNGMQSDGDTAGIIDIDLNAMFTAAGWEVFECDGHNTAEISAALRFENSEVPKCIIAKTVKGKGVSFMENNNAWHHNKLNTENYQKAMSEVSPYGV
jgi:transketolase